MAGALPGGPGGVVGKPPPKPTKTNTNPGTGVRDAPMGKGSGGHGTAPISGKLTPLMKKQRFLKNQGFYTGRIDGIRGPLTNQAIKAFKAHVKARLATGGKGGGKGGGGGGGGGGGRGGGGRGGGGKGGGMGKFPALIRPMADAKAAVQAQYGPLIAQLQLQRDQVQSQGAQNLADIGSYYDQLANTLHTQQAAGSQFAQAQLGQQHNDQTGILAALGGGANPGGLEAGNFAALMHGALQGQMDSQANYLTNQQTLGAQMRAQALTDQQRLTDQSVQGINQQLQSQQAAKGSAYISALDNARQQLLQQLAAKQNMQIAAGQFGLSMAQGGAQLRNMQLQNKQLAKGQGFGSLTAGDKAKLVEGVNSMMYNPADGSAAARPNQAWVKAANHLRALGYDVKKNVKVRNWLAVSWANYVKDYNAAHPNSQYHPAANGTPFTNKQWNS